MLTAVDDLQACARGWLVRRATPAYRAGCLTRREGGRRAVDCGTSGGCGFAAGRARRRAAPPAAGADDGSEYDSEYDSDCTSYSVFEETDEILEMTGLELEEESRFGGGFRW